MSEVTAVPLRPTPPRTVAALWSGVGLAIALALVGAWWGTQAQVVRATPPAEFLAENGKHHGVVTTPSGLQYQVLKPGAGARATAADMALVNYDGKLADGSQFDSNAAQGTPVAMPVGGLIPGFSEGLQLMSRGEKARFWIPPQLGYGARDVPDPKTGKVVIPANSVLVFDVELIDLAPAPPQMGMPGMAPPGGEGAPGR